MGYAQQHLARNEVIVKKADRNGLFLLGAWFKGIFGCIISAIIIYYLRVYIAYSFENSWNEDFYSLVLNIISFFYIMVVVPIIKAIIATVKFYHIELSITNKRIIGKVGVFNTQSLDAPLNKIQNVFVSQTLLGKIFNYSIIAIDTAVGRFEFDCIKSGENLKSMIMAQIDKYEEDRISQQANQMANAVAGAIRRY